ncbi:transposase domain-containing protein [Bacillus anthracis]|uniref:transposase domain-containing protein n=1 Tax=Bacillus anthracis TaxID=1392 RepID=UPI0021C118D7|nr:transposase domain-containing protein [Bacillus anthracis]
MYSVIETSKENNLSPYHYLRYLFEMLPNIDLHNKEEINKVFPWSTDLQSRCRMPKKMQTKNNSKINFYCMSWSDFLFTFIYNF